MNVATEAMSLQPFMLASFAEKKNNFKP